MKSNKPTVLSNFHTTLGIIALILLPLPGKPAYIGMLLLILPLLRLPTTLKTLCAFLQKPIVLFLLVWCLFAYISILWSENPNRSLLTSPLILIIIPSLYPLKEKSKYLILALGFGVAIHTTIQVLMWLGVMHGVRYGPGTISGGLHWYPPFTALWSSASMFLLLGLAFTTPSRRTAVLATLLLIPVPLSLLISGNKTVFFVIPIATIFLAIQCVSLTKTRRKRIAIIVICSFIIFITICFSFVPGTTVSKRNAVLLKQTMKATNLNKPQHQSKKKTLPKELREVRVDRYVSSFGLRYVWWRAGYIIWKESPWIGHGAGASLKQFAWAESQIPTERGADVEGFITPEPHSSILATAIEQGLLGILLITSSVLFALIRSWRFMSANPSLIGLSAAWVSVIAFGFVHTIQFSTYASTLILVLFVFTLYQYPKVEKAV